MDKVSWGIIIPAVLLAFWGGFMVTSAWAVPANVNHVKKEWCQSEGGMWLENKCWQSGKEMTLK